MTLHSKIVQTDIILPHNGPWVHSVSNRYEYQEYYGWGGG